MPAPDAYALHSSEPQRLRCISLQRHPFDHICPAQCQASTMGAKGTSGSLLQCQPLKRMLHSSKPQGHKLIRIFAAALTCSICQDREV